MDDSEIEARFGALRTALALAISVGRTPSEMQHLRASLRDIIAFVPEGAHPALQDELERVLSTFVRLPTHHASAEPVHHPTPPAQTHQAMSAALHDTASLSEASTIAELL